MSVTIPGINPGAPRTLPMVGDVAEVGNGAPPATQLASAQISYDAIVPQAKGITGLTGGGATNLDGITTTVSSVVILSLPFFLIIHPVIGGVQQTQGWMLKISSATPGSGVVQPTDNSTLRWIQTF